jgi:hypothetical protein
VLLNYWEVDDDTGFNIYHLDSDRQRLNHIDAKTWNLFLLHLFYLPEDQISLQLEDISVAHSYPIVRCLLYVVVQH